MDHVEVHGLLVRCASANPCTAPSVSAGRLEQVAFGDGTLKDLKDRAGGSSPLSSCTCLTTDPWAGKTIDFMGFLPRNQLFNIGILRYNR